MDSEFDSPNNGVDTSVKTFPVEKKKKRVLEGVYWWQKAKKTRARIAHALVYCREWKPNLLKYKHAWYSELKKTKQKQTRNA